MILYADTSALVKLYVREVGSDRVRRRLHKAQVIATSVVAYAEARSAFARLLRDGHTTRAWHLRRLTRLNTDWDHLVKIELLPEVARSAGDIAELQSLRGFDAIHLASALWLKAQTTTVIEFAAFDRRLATAAADSGLRNAIA